MQAERGRLGFHEVREALTHIKVYISYEQVNDLCCQSHPEDSIGSDIWEQIVMKNYQEKINYFYADKTNCNTLHFTGAPEFFCSQQVLG